MKTQSTKVVLLVCAVILSTSSFCYGQQTKVDLWNPTIAYPAVDEIPTVPGVEYSIVHQQTPDHFFCTRPDWLFMETRFS